MLSFRREQLLLYLHLYKVILALQSVFRRSLQGMFWSHPLLPLICVSSPNIMNRMTSHPSSRRAILFIILGLKTQITGGNGRDQIICSKAANIPYSKSWSTRISIKKSGGKVCLVPTSSSGSCYCIGYCTVLTAENLVCHQQHTRDVPLQSASKIHITSI